jgi:release factor glutamine methyltransferase
VNLSSLVGVVRESLEKAGIPSPVVDAESIVSHVLGIPRSHIYLEPERPVGWQDESRILVMAGERGRRVPLQYIIGECEFMSLPFKVRRGVFIPRPETEVLVEALAGRAAEMDRGSIKILDLGAGSGVIGVSLAALLKPDIVVATDISMLAMKTAVENAILNGVQDTVQFVVGDGLSFVKGLATLGKAQGFDLVACNPPYVPSGEIAGLEPEVRDHDPRPALDGGAGGLEFIERIVPELPSIMNEGGIVGFEMGASQADMVRAVFERSGIGSLEILQDLSGRDRVITGRLGWTR